MSRKPSALECVGLFIQDPVAVTGEVQVNFEALLVLGLPVVWYHNVTFCNALHSLARPFLC